MTAMTIQMVSYLFRYIFIFLLVGFVWLLLREALVSLRHIMKKRVMPVSGVFLFCEPEAGSCLSLPLFHMTTIGRAKSSDIRFRDVSIAPRHAMIYLFDGVWFLRPLHPKHPVMIDSVRILSPTPLEDQDKVTIGSKSMTFLADRAATFTASMDELANRSWSEDGLPGHRRTKRLTGLFFNLFVLLGSMFILFLFPDSLIQVRSAMILYLFGFWAVSNLYLFLLPRILKESDRTLLICFLLLAFIGLMIQIRLTIPEAMINQENIFRLNWISRLMADLRRLIDSALGLPVQPAEPVPVSDEVYQLGAAILGRIRTQIFSLGIGLILLVPTAILVARTRMMEVLIVLCAVFTPMLLLATLLLGNGADSHGATLWIQVGGLSLQLTEFAKITYLVVVAGFFKNRPSRRMQLLFAAWAGFVFFLIMLLPDLGSAMILLPTTLLVYVVMTSEYLTTLLILFAGTGLGGLAFALFPHVQRRILGWTTLWIEVNDSNRQIVYGLQAMVRGGLFGRGVANGSPAGIPLASSDMIFAVLCEEMGLLTGLSLVLIFIIIWLRATRLTILAPDGFRSSLALAVGTMLFVEAVIVIAGTTGLMPLTGATLPLIARGGSSALAKLLLLGILLGLSVRPKDRVREVSGS